MTRSPEAFAVHQIETAEGLGYGRGPAAVDAMNRDHDPLHASLCAWLGVPSLSLRVAEGAELAGADLELADIEEAAVLAVQRFMVAARASVPPLPRAQP